MGSLEFKSIIDIHVCPKKAESPGSSSRLTAFAFHVPIVERI